MRTAEPQAGATKLAAHAYRIELAGDIRELDYPPLCPNCGNSASQSLYVRKPFIVSYSGSDSPTEFRIGAACVPYCASCIEEHRRNPDRLSLPRRFLACFASGEMFAAAGSALFGLFLLKEAFGDLIGHPDGAVALFVFAGVMGLISWGSYRAAYRKTEPFVIPAQSSTTIAFDFSDDLSGPYEPERRIYAVRNEQFAAAFATLNRNKVWDPKAPVARRADTLFKITVGAVVVFGVVMWLLD